MGHWLEKGDREFWEKEIEGLLKFLHKLDDLSHKIEIGSLNKEDSLKWSKFLKNKSKKFKLLFLENPDEIRFYTTIIKEDKESK